MLKITEEDLKKIYNQKKSRFDKKKKFVSAGFTSIKLKEFNDWASKTNQKCHYCGISNDERNCFMTYKETVKEPMEQEVVRGAKD